MHDIKIFSLLNLDSNLLIKNGRCITEMAKNIEENMVKYSLLLFQFKRKAIEKNSIYQATMGIFLSLVTIFTNCVIG